MEAVQLFDRKLEFQFSFIFKGHLKSISAEMLPRLPKIASAEFDAGPKLRMRLSDQKTEEALIGVGSQSVNVPVVTWTGGIWRLSFSPLRVDLVADALAYFDVATKELVLDTVRKRVADNLATMANELDAEVSRFALIVNVEASRETMENPAVVVADTYFNDDIRAAVANEQTIEVTGRTNAAVSWELEKAGSIKVNRIEQLSSHEVYEAGAVSNRFRVLLDVNTSPWVSARLPPSALPRFYESACKWVDERLSAVKESSR